MEKFSVFPAGAQGAALLALRISLGCVLISHSLASAALLPDVILFICAGVLLIGGAVRIIAIIALVLAMLDLASFNPLVVVHALDSAAVAILGGGAYSLDARLFGRRTIRIDPPLRRTTTTDRLNLDE